MTLHLGSIGPSPGGGDMEENWVITREEDKEGKTQI